MSLTVSDSNTCDNSTTMKKLDLIGQTFHQLTVIARADNLGGRTTWLCDCSCGNTVVVLGVNLRNGNTESCGCLKANSYKLAARANVIHGLSKSRLYSTWRGMLARCYNQNDPKYYLWGGRGITVCNEWRESFVPFRDWALESGYQDNLTIDRISSNGNYCPNNCRWVTRAENSSRKSNNIRIKCPDGIVRTLSQISKLTGLTHSMLYQRYAKCTTISYEMLTQPRKKKGRPR